MSVEQSVSDLIADIKAKIEAAKADGKLSGAELAGIVGACLSFAAGRIVEIVSAQPVDGQTKRTMAVESLTLLTMAIYDDVIVPLDVPYVPGFIEERVEGLLRPTVQAQAEYVAGLLVDSMYDLLKKYLKP